MHAQDMKLDAPELDQRGRAAIDFSNSLLVGLSGLGAKVNEEIKQNFGDGGDLPADLDERAQIIETQMAKSHDFRTQQMVGDWHARNHGKVAVAAFEEIEDRLQPSMKAAEVGPSTLTLDPDLALPAYWDKVAFHRTGTWDSHPQMGYIHSELVHKAMVAKFADGGIFKPRRDIAASLPRDDYRAILEMGASSGHFTMALAETYPNARIVGIDLSPRMLEHAWRSANASGHTVELYQRNAEASGFADASFDLVASFILLHELPADAIRNVFAEAFRVLEPGGDMIMSDVTRYADLDPIAEWRADRGARLGGEPHWRASASLDLAEVGRSAGFIDVEADGIYPHVVRGRKPW